MNRRQTALLASLLTAFTLTSFPSTIMAQEARVVAAQEPGTLTSTGTAKVQRAPDFLQIVCGVSLDGKTASEAQANAATTLANAVKAMKELKLGEEYLQTDRVQLTPLYKRDAQYDTTREVIGYRATISVIIRTSDLDASPRIIDAALSAGCNTIDSLEFGIKEALAAREEAMVLATKAAKRKAEVLAGALEVKLGRVKHTETTSPNSWGSNRFSNMAQSVSRDSGPSENQDAFNPGMVEVWATVNITYELDQSGH
jgi:uncharacterized protein YggE